MNEQFECVPLTSDGTHLEQIKDFCIDREADCRDLEDVVGLESYLKRCAWHDDLNNEVRIYLIKDRDINEVVAYFGLRAGMAASSMHDRLTAEEQEALLQEKGIKLFPEVVPGIEISHFAVNDNYRRKVAGKNGPPKGLGRYFYPRFIYPIIEDVAKKIGVNLVYLYAAGDEKLVS